jgi:hypothetical protein
MTDLEYNTQRKSIPLPEYGRNLQKMVTKVVNMKDREKRTRYAHQIIEIMIQINPTAKDSPELRHKLWDHLHIMSDFKLDIDSPFPLPDKEVLKTQPELLSYPDDNLKYNYYGRIIQNIIDVVAEMENGQEKDFHAKNIANQMKKSYLMWNRDTVEDSLIIQHLSELSNNKIKLPENFQLKRSSELVGHQQMNKRKGGSQGQQGKKRKRIKYNPQGK